MSGRFLEHSRIYYFRNNGEEQVWIGSADLMPRNIDHRVEVLVPIRDPAMIRHIHDDVLVVYLSDNVKARRMLPSGAYQRRRGQGQNRAASQELLMQVRRAASDQEPHAHPKPGPPIKSA